MCLIALAFRARASPFRGLTITPPGPTVSLRSKLSADRPSCGVRIQLDDPGLLPDLLACLGRDAIAERIGENELDVSLVNSMTAEEAEVELTLRLRVWQLAHPDAVLRVS